MNLNKIVLTTSSYILLSMVIAYPWHMFWFYELYSSWGAFTRPDPVVPLGLMAMLLQGIVIAILYPVYYQHAMSKNPLQSGIKFRH